MKSSLVVLGLAALLAAPCLRADPFTVTEGSMGANEVVSIGSSTIGSNVQVYAGLIDIQINGTTTFGFCIDPWHWSDTGAQSYNSETLGDGPKPPGPMGATVALEIEQLWQHYYSATMSNSAAAGLQIAIWTLVGDEASAVSNGSAWFALDQSNSYGASTDLAWLAANANAAAANLIALTGPGQDYVVATSALPPSVTSASTTGKTNTSFSFAIAADQSPTSYGAAHLPTGLSVNSSTGVISGTPMTAGTYNATISASNASGTGSASLAITVSTTYTLTISANPSAGGTFSGYGTYDPNTVVTISETPASGYRASGWGGTNGNNTASSSSPTTTIAMAGNRTLVAEFVRQASLTVTATTGGTATGSGNYDIGTSVPIKATPNSGYVFTSWSGTGIAGAGSASTTVDLSGNESVTASFIQLPVFTQTPNQTDVIGQAVSLQVTASANPTYSATHLPTGLSIGSAGLITGTPTTTGTWTATITAANAGGSASETVAFTVIRPPAITSSLTSSGMQNEPYSYTITASGSPTSFGASGLPPGLSVNTTSGAITGTPTSSGTYSVTLAATNSGVSGSATLQLTITPTYTLAISGSPAAGGSYTGFGTYPAGTVVTITETAASGYRASGWSGPDAGATAIPTSATTTITMSANRTVVATFAQQVILTVIAGPGGTATGSGTYDMGATVPIVATPASGYLFGEWTGSGVTSVNSASTTVTLAGNESVTANFVQPPAFTDGNGPQTLVTNQGSTLQETATNSPTYGATGLPPGLTINPTTGVISGTPTSAGSWPATITATNGGGSAQETIGFTVYDTPVITSSDTASGKLNEPLGYTATASGNPTSYGASGLPPGLVFNSTAATITGTPTEAGSFPVTLTASNAGATGTATLNLTVTQTYQLTITGSPSNGGSYPAGGIYDPGTVVTIAETANPGYRPAGWGGPDGGATASPNNSVTTITMNADCNVTAEFVAEGTLAVTAGTGGTATGGGTYDIGTSVTITALPSSGYAFSNWSGASADDPSAAISTITVTGDLSVQANFSVVPQPPVVNLTAATTAYTGSPFHVSSEASAPGANLSLHSIEWLSPDGTTWTVDSQEASGANDSMTEGITFPSTGTWTIRAGASTDDGNTWVYSSSVQVTVSNGTTSYTLETMAMPGSSSLQWYSASPVVQKTYQVQHTNP